MSRASLGGGTRRAVCQRAAAVTLVLVATPVLAVRSRWRQALEGVVAIEEVVEAAALEQSLATLRPAILLLDLGLPRFAGVKSLPALQCVSPLTKIVLFSRASDQDQTEAIAAIKAGARGYCQVDIPPVLLKKAVERIQLGEIWVGRNVILHLLEELISVTERQQQNPPAQPDRRLEDLTPREREIAGLIGEAASNKEIASRFSISEKTVKAHLTAIFRKLGLADRLHLALLVTQRGRVPLRPDAT